MRIDFCVGSIMSSIVRGIGGIFCFVLCIMCSVFRFVSGSGSIDSRIGFDFCFDGSIFGLSGYSVVNRCSGDKACGSQHEDVFIHRGSPVFRSGTSLPCWGVSIRKTL